MTQNKAATLPSLSLSKKIPLLREGLYFPFFRQHTKKSKNLCAQNVNFFPQDMKRKNTFPAERERERGGGAGGLFYVIKFCNVVRFLTMVGLASVTPGACVVCPGREDTHTQDARGKAAFLFLLNVRF